MKLFQNEYGFFANPRPMLLTKEFMPCVSQGQINLFELEREYYSSGYNPNLGFSPSYTKKINTYYNVGLGNLKLADYDNLSIDLADNLEAMSHLQRFKKQTISGFSVFW